MPASTFAELADHRFVSLSTFRRSGAPVPTVVWIARAGDALVVTTLAGSGKVKRLRRDPRVTLQPSDRWGGVADAAPSVAAVASVEAPSESAVRALKRKYGLEYQIVTTMERVLGRGRRVPVILRITAA